MPGRKIVYEASDYQRDMNSLSETETGNRQLDLAAFKRLMVHELCTKTDLLQTHRFANYPIERIQRALRNPQNSGAVLIDVSRYLVNISMFYMRLVRYFAGMGLFHYSIDIYDLKRKQVAGAEGQNRLQEAYGKVCAEFEKIGLRHEMSKIMRYLLIEDVFYGLIYENEDDFFIVRLNPEDCRIAQIQDGVYNYKVNLGGLNPLSLSGYPEFLQQAYLDYCHQVNYLDGWYVPPADRQICFKFNEQCLFPMPFLLSLMEDILDLDTYKHLKLQKARVDNYKAIVIEIPLDRDAVDKPLLTDETLSAFAEMNKANMPEDVGLIHAPGNAEAVSFRDNANTTNNLSDAIANIYDNAGVSNELFNGGSAGTALKMSIENDAVFIYTFYRQCERYFTRLIKLRKFNRPAYKFALRIQDSTVFNRMDVADAYLKAAQNGLPFKLDYGIALGKSPGRLLGSLYLENQVLRLQDWFIPLITSYTSTGDRESGRPTNESQGQELDVSGEITRDTEANLNR